VVGLDPMSILTELLDIKGGQGLSIVDPVAIWGCCNGALSELRALT
jgi:hypothetical protein